jgi:hypothetical protein
MSQALPEEEMYFDINFYRKLEDKSAYFIEYYKEIANKIIGFKS